MSSQAVYAIFVNDMGQVQREPGGVFNRKTAMQLAAALRRSTGRKIYARRVDIALTRPTPSGANHA